MLCITGNGLKTTDVLTGKYESEEPIPPKINYVRHDGEGLRQMQQFFGVKPDDLAWSGGLVRRPGLWPVRAAWRF